METNASSVIPREALIHTNPWRSVWWNTLSVTYKPAGRAWVCRYHPQQQPSLRNIYPSVRPDRSRLRASFNRYRPSRRADRWKMSRLTCPQLVLLCIVSICLRHRIHKVMIVQNNNGCHELFNSNKKDLIQKLVLLFFSHSNNFVSCWRLSLCSELDRAESEQSRARTGKHAS